MKKIIIILICIILLFTGCTKSNSKQEEKEVENTVSEYFRFLKNQDFDRAKTLCTDNKGLFNDFDV